jgi:hypothetical protein
MKVIDLQSDKDLGNTLVEMYKKKERVTILGLRNRPHTIYIYTIFAI